MLDGSLGIWLYQSVEYYDITNCDVTDVRFPGISGPKHLKHARALEHDNRRQVREVPVS